MIKLSQPVIQYNTDLFAELHINNPDFWVQ